MKSASYNRREFLKTGGLLGTGLWISFFVPAGAKNLISPNEAPAALFTPNAYLSIGSDNVVKIILAHVEMGQGIWTTLPMLIAEELDCDWDKIRVEHAPPSQAYLHTTYGQQMTGGSTSTWSEFDRYRQAGATARMLLVEAAANKFKVPASECRTEKGFVVAGSKRASFGELAQAASKLSPPAMVPLKDKKEWQYIGKPTKRLDAKAKITGEAMFGMDVHFPGMLIAMVAHAPVFGATVKSVDASAAKGIAGVQQVVQVPTGVAVIATNTWAAKQGREALQIDWDLGPGAGLDSTTQLQAYRKLATTKGAIAAQTGNVGEAIAKAGKKLEAEFVFPYLAHAPMEPINCTVKISGDTCEIWAGVQMPQVDQAAAAKILGFKPEQVKVNTTFLGGGFGRRTTFDSDFIAEAVHVAKASGKFIKLVWSREDDIRGGYYRAAFLHRATVGLGGDGFPVAWQHTIVGQSIHMQGTPFSKFMKNGIDNTSVEGIRSSPYLESVPAFTIDLHSPTLPVPVLWWRSVGHTHTGFVMEALMDELAYAAGKDPVAYRRSLLKSKRHLAALDLVVEKSGWGKLCSPFIRSSWSKQ